MAITPTTITTEDQIYLTDSHITVKVQNLAAANTIKSAVLELYVWSGDLDTPPSTATQTFIGNKVSIERNYIDFEISDIVRSYITGTKLAWESGDNEPSISGEGVFFQYKYQVTNENGFIESPITGVSNFATLGYRYDYEQVGDIVGPSLKQPYLGLIPEDYTNRKFTDKIKYFKREFDFTKTLSECTSENIIKSTVIVPTSTHCQFGDKFLVVYINRLGLWDYFTPFGKVLKSVKVDSETNSRLYSDLNRINNNINHSKTRRVNDTKQAYVINSGDLFEAMTPQIEEVIYSPMVYLIEFTGETYTIVQEGLTVDSTDVTVDSTLYTVDNHTITATDIGYYSKYKQIPVTCSTSDFVKKTRLNDKGKINYDLSFESTIGKLNNLR